MPTDRSSERPSRRRALIAFRLLAVSTLALSHVGCNVVVLLGYLIGGPPSIEPDFDSRTGQSMTAKETKVVVVCYAANETKYNYENVDFQLAKYVTYRLFQHNIQVVNSDQVRAWLDENDDWDQPEEIASTFGANYVIYIDLTDYNLYEENSAELYRGRADAVVSVFEIDEGGSGERIYSKEINSVYPILQGKSTADISYWTFERAYLTRLSEEVGRLFYEHFAGDDIPDGA